MLEKLLCIDTELFVYLNSLGSDSYDPFWLLITKQFNWIPLFVFFLYLVFKKTGGKQTLILLLFIAALITFTDQTTNLFKNGFQRLRPCSNPEISSIIRIVQSRSSFSFFSGHASNSMAVATFLFLILRRYYKYVFLIFLWPLIFAYSRIYLGLHYPLDIFSGYVFGILSGFLMFKIYSKLQAKYFPY